MKFLYYITMFIAMSLTANAQMQHQHIIPITACPTVNTEHIQTAQPAEHKVNKKRKFTQKTSIVRHPKLKKVCIYGGCALGGIVAGICLVTFGLPIIISTILIGIEIVVRIKGYLIRINY